MRHARSVACRCSSQRHCPRGPEAPEADQVQHPGRTSQPNHAAANSMHNTMWIPQSAPASSLVHVVHQRPRHHISQLVEGGHSQGAQVGRRGAHQGKHPRHLHQMEGTGAGEWEDHNSSSRAGDGVHVRASTGGTSSKKGCARSSCEDETSHSLAAGDAHFAAAWRPVRTTEIIAHAAEMTPHAAEVRAHTALHDRVAAEG